MDTASLTSASTRCPRQGCTLRGTHRGKCCMAGGTQIGVGLLVEDVRVNDERF